MTAVLVTMCPDRVDHLASLLSDTTQIEATDGRRLSPSQIKTDRVFRSCVEGLAVATHVVVETDYFDMDYRSLASILVGHRHEPPRLKTGRLVFLRSDRVIEVGDDGPAALSLHDALDFIDGATVHGYMVLSPDPDSIVGRSMVAPPEGMAHVLPSVVVPAHIRTRVTEYVSLVGARKSVTGIPFMKQDGSTISCAHAAAWMAHYTSVLRGTAPRRPLVQFHTETDGLAALARRYPSGGLSAEQVETLLEGFDLSVEPIDNAILLQGSRKPRWSDRDDVFALYDRVRTAGGVDPDASWSTAVAAAEAAGATEEMAAADAFWRREYLTSSVASYLNSGFPSVLLDDSHAQVITGYLRAKDVDLVALYEEEGLDVQQLPGVPLGDATAYPAEDEKQVSEPSALIEAAVAALPPTAVVAFVVADDQLGPYNLRSVESVLQSFSDRDLSTTILTPLPRGIWLSPAKAEDMACLAFLAGVIAVQKALSASTDPDAATLRVHVPNDDLLPYKAKLDELGNQIIRRELSVRSYVVPSADYKGAFSERCKHDPIAVGKVRVADLPKYVWVMEVMHRDTRNRRPQENSVLGEVVLDPTDVGFRESRALIAHLPGAIQVSADGSNGAWHVSTLYEMYESGRVNHNTDWSVHPHDLAARFKSACSS